MVYAYLFVWETKGLTLEQVDRMMEETQSPRKSASWKPHSTFAGELGITEGGKMPIGITEAHQAGEKAHIAAGTSHLHSTDPNVGANANANGNVPVTAPAPVTTDANRSAV